LLPHFTNSGPEPVSRRRSSVLSDSRSNFAASDWLSSCIVIPHHSRTTIVVAAGMENGGALSLLGLLQLIGFIWLCSDRSRQRSAARRCAWLGRWSHRRLAQASSSLLGGQPRIG